MDGSIRAGDRTEQEHGRAGGMSEELRILEALLFAARDEAHNNAVALKEYLS